MINGKNDKSWFLIYNMMKHLNCIAIGKYTSISHVQSGSGVSSEDKISVCRNVLAEAQ